MEEAVEPAAEPSRKKPVVLKGREAVEARGGSGRAAYNKRRRTQRKWAKWQKGEGDGVPLASLEKVDDGLDVTSEE